MGELGLNAEAEFAEEEGRKVAAGASPLGPHGEGAPPPLAAPATGAFRTDGPSTDPRTSTGATGGMTSGVVLSGGSVAARRGARGEGGGFVGVGVGVDAASGVGIVAFGVCIVSTLSLSLSLPLPSPIASAVGVPASSSSLALPSPRSSAPFSSSLSHSLAVANESTDVPDANDAIEERRESSIPLPLPFA